MNYHLAQTFAAHYIRKYPSLRGLPMDEIIIQGIMRNSHTWIPGRATRNRRATSNSQTRAQRARNVRRKNLLNKRRG